MTTSLFIYLFIYVFIYLFIYLFKSFCIGCKEEFSGHSDTQLKARVFVYK